MQSFTYYIIPGDGPIVAWAIVDAATDKTVDVVLRSDGGRS